MTIGHGLYEEKIVKLQRSLDQLSFYKNDTQKAGIAITFDVNNEEKTAVSNIPGFAQ